MYPFLSLLDGNGFEVHLRKVAANITVNLESKSEAILVLTIVPDEPMMASQRCKDLILDVQALHCPLIVSIVDIFENRSIWK